MRAGHRAVGGALAAAIAAGAFACNFLVDAQFASGKPDAGEGGLPEASCTLGSGAPSDPACGTCMLSTCGAYWSAICKDGTSATGAGALGDCSDDPSVVDGLCERIWLPEAGPYASPNDPQTHYFNMRKCVTEGCRTQCTTCDGMVYRRYAGDTKGAPLTPAVGACASCLLSNCGSVLIGKGTQFGHCCYQDRIDDTWGPCVRDPKNSGDQAPDCSGVKMYGHTDAGANAGCDEALSVCAVDNCSSECGGL